MRDKLFPFQGPRLIFFSVVMFCIFIVLMIRLYELQFVRYEAFEAAARENAVQAVPLPSTRGVIYDRYGVPLALNAPAFNVAIIPAELPDDEAATLDVLNRLAALIDVPATRAAADAAGKRFVRSLQELVVEGEGIAPYRPVVVATDIDQRIAQIILENLQTLPGVRVDTVSVRQYPSGEITSQIIGYLGPIGEEEANELREQGYNPAFERVGYAGVEAYLERQLAGKRGLETRIVDVAGLPVSVIKRDEPQSGQSVRLTIDLALQQAATQALQDRINIINANAQALVTISGTVIAMDPRTGEILAMVSLPTYDNRRFARAIDGEYYTRIAQEAQTPLVNHAIQSLYPPGSVWKLVTAAGVLQENVIPAKAELFDGGDLFIENSFAQNDVGQRQRFVCWLRSGHERVDMVKGIAWSCDVYFYQVGGGNPDPKVSSVLRPGGLGIKDLNRYATAFNIGVRTGIELPGENAGRLPDPSWKRRNYGESWSTGDTYNAAFGQGYVTVTPLQLLVSSVALSNGGVLWQPTIIKDWLDSEGNVTQAFTPKVNRTILPPKAGQTAILNIREDMYIQGKKSLACICEARSPYKDPNNQEYYDPNLPACTPEFVSNYRATVRTEKWGDVPYTVHIPFNYRFGGVCNPLQINDFLYRDYQPPFVEPQHIRVVEEGMLGAVYAAGGTATAADLGYERVGGKTGTAEYCDNIAAPKGLCIPGQWPSHAWFYGYAPFEAPEIAVIAFVYNAGEGSKNALPVAKAVMDCYFKLKSERLTAPDPTKVSCTPLQQ
jgi:penicillin-binding protein 2